MGLILRALCSLLDIHTWSYFGVDKVDVVVARICRCCHKKQYRKYVVSEYRFKWITQ